ncbi:4-coumarate:CoA ligase-like protein [Rhynchospora pubera]|uniref:4-coumarate--CoA ligase n=1 Tax=Rhynchospora pubera TaxID=906938 RepID=A0AAV8E242_9POAL|nr:4-coumarate:CoA ligase-like protein [Rhynchospora pubera]
MEGSIRCAANYAPLSPLSFLERAAVVYADRTAVIYGSKRYTWRQTRDRCLMIASSLALLGVSRGDVVAVLAANVPAMYELHFGVPMAGAILCTLNTRHDAAMLSTLLKHSEAKVLLVELHFLETAQAALELISRMKSSIPLLITISDSDTVASDVMDYEALLLKAPTRFEIRWPLDECDPISLNYTSGTTSRPKGVIYSHRGAYLNTVSTLLAHDICTMPLLLWTVPMFHCNGWCLAWGMAAQGGVNICIRNVTAKAIFDNIALHKVTHLGGAPTVLNIVINSPLTERKPLPGKVVFFTGGAPPPPKVLSEMEKLGFQVNHLYGLTETYGPATTCTWRPEWDTLPVKEKVKLKALQGLHNISIEEVDIKDPITMKSVPNDGRTMGEVMFRGNAIMSGYYKDPAATKEVMKDGWLRSGDLGVKHPIGYIQLKDRSKDIIISGGENISTIEVESVIYSHPAVLEAAVVARPDHYWGETPCAFVKLKDGFSVGEKEIIKFCREKLPHYMAPRSVVFSELPKTSTGKIQKYVLREKAKALGSLSKKGMGKL